MHDMTEELYLYVIHSGSLYSHKKACFALLDKHASKATWDMGRAPKVFTRFLELAAKQYIKELGIIGQWYQRFDQACREQVAMRLFEQWQAQRSI